MPYDATQQKNKYDGHPLMQWLDQVGVVAAVLALAAATVPVTGVRAGTVLVCCQVLRARLVGRIRV